MLSEIYDKLDISSPVAVTIISISLMLFLGFAATRLTKLAKLPNVTAYILTGIIIGPFALDLIPGKIIEGTDFIADIALAFIAFSTGEFFKLSVLKKNGAKVILITVFEALTASILVFTAAYFVLGLNLPFSIVLAALASATAPASTLMTVRQTGSKGDFVDTLLQVVALDDVVGLLAYSSAISVALASVSGGEGDFSFKTFSHPIIINAGVLALGAVFGVFMKLLMPKRRSTDNRLIISVSLLFAFCGICAMLDVSPLLGCMSMGTVYINLTGDDKLFNQINYFSPPILLLFFVRSGLSFDLGSLFGATGEVGGSPLLVIGVIYFIVRIAGKYIGAFVGCAITGKEKRVRNYLGFALIPQAGIAIGLAALGARSLGGETGNALQTIILASSVLYELVGPASAKFALYMSRSYSTKLEEITTVDVIKPGGEAKTTVEILVERIKQIQDEIPKRPEISEEERAFEEAAEEQYEVLEYMRRQRFRKKR